MADLALYRLAKQHTEDVVASLDDAQLAQTCQACPLWSIRDVIAHHVHFLGAFVDDAVPREMCDALSGDEDGRDEAGQTRDDWTQAGVEARRGLPLDDVLAEWSAIVESMSPKGAQALVDLTMHLADIHETLGTGRRPEQPLVDDALATYFHFFLIPRLAQAGLAPVVLECTDTGDELTAHDDGTTVRGSSYDLLRIIGGRRTRAQADATIDWCGTLRETRELFCIYGWPS